MVTRLPLWWEVGCGAEAYFLGLLGSGFLEFKEC